MKFLLFTFTLLFISNSYAQDFVAHSTWTNEVYRGYENKMVIGSLNAKNKFKIEGRNCTITHLEENTYIVKVKPEAKSVYIRFLDKKGNAKDSIGFRVLNLPKPQLMIGAPPHKDSINRIQGSVLRAVYGPEIPLMAIFEVVRWECPAPGGVIKGDGNSINSEVKEFFNSLKGGESMTIIAEVRFPDGTTQTISQSWTKK